MNKGITIRNELPQSQTVVKKSKKLKQCKNGESNISSVKRNTLSNETSFTSNPRKQKQTVNSTNTETIQEQGIFLVSEFSYFISKKIIRICLLIKQPKNT